jgi:hypothetical protein
MRFLLTILYYFDLRILPGKPMLGKDKKERKQKAAKRARKRFWLTLGLYVAAFLGVLGENLISQFNASNTIDWSAFGLGRFLVALVITTVIFPPIFREAFAEMEREKPKAAGSHRFIQFCVAFQNGFFWPALLRAVGELIGIPN